jgi:tetratricopeptide (TPR) repeat protein
MRQSRLQWAEAERNLRDALEGSAKCGAAYELAALIRWRDGNRDVLNGLITSQSGPSLPIWVLLGRITDLSASGDTASALELIESGRERARRSCQWGDLVSLEGALLSILVNRGDTTRALELGAKTLKVSEHLGADDTTAMLFLKLGYVHLMLEQPDVALGYFQRSLELNQRLGRRVAASRLKFEIARTHYDRSDYVSAKKYLDAIDPATVNPDLKMAVLRERARLSRAMGLLDQAEKSFEEARLLAQQLGQRPNEAAIMADLGELQLARCDIPGALKLFEEALQIAVAADRVHSAEDIRGWIETARKTKCTRKAP